MLSSQADIVARIDLLTKAVEKIIFDLQRIEQGPIVCPKYTDLDGNPIDLPTISAQMQRVVVDISDLKDGKTQYYGSIEKDLESIRSSFLDQKKTGSEKEGEKSQENFFNSFETKLGLLEDELTKLKEDHGRVEKLIQQRQLYARGEDVTRLKRAMVAFKKRIFDSACDSGPKNAPPADFTLTADPSQNFERIRTALNELRSSEAHMDSQIQGVSKNLIEMKGISESLVTLESCNYDVPKIKRALISLKKKALNADTSDNPNTEVNKMVEERLSALEKANLHTGNSSEEKLEELEQRLSELEQKKEITTEDVAKKVKKASQASESLIDESETKLRGEIESLGEGVDSKIDDMKESLSKEIDDGSRKMKEISDKVNELSTRLEAETKEPKAKPLASIPEELVQKINANTAAIADIQEKLGSVIGWIQTFAASQAAAQQQSAQPQAAQPSAQPTAA